MLAKIKFNKNFYRFFIALLLFSALFSAVFLCAKSPVLAQDPDIGMDYAANLDLAQSDKDIRIVLVEIVRYLITFLGIVAVSIIMYAGFLWMTSGGDESKIAKAKKTLVNAVIGLIIIVSAFAIVTFIINKMGGSSSGGYGLGEGSGPRESRGLAALGNCTIESVYPEPNQEEVPRNTAIIVTFREEVNPNTICDDSNNNGCHGEMLIRENVRIFEDARGDDCEASDCNNNITDVLVSSNDNRTFVFEPQNYLGSPSEYIWHRIVLTNDIQKTDGTGVFDTCSFEQYFSWRFEVSNVLDLTSPQVKNGGVFPVPDNEMDNIVTSSAIQAEGSITVDSQPTVRVWGTFSNPVAVGGAPNASISSINRTHDQSGDLRVSIQSDNSTVLLSNDTTSISLGSANIDFVDNTVVFPGYFTLTVLGSYGAGDSWTINADPMIQGDTLIVGNRNYIFVDNANEVNEIESGINEVGTANNIGAALVSYPEVIANISGDTINLTALVAGTSGNNINLESSSNNLLISPMTGGINAGETVTQNGKKDQPRNAIIQINFNEAINPLTASGYASDVEDYIKVVNASSSNGAGVACSNDADCLSYNCEALICVNDYLSGKFEISNQYRTVEFIPDDLCGVNGCGERVYCLPGNSNLRVDLFASELSTCTNNDDCARYSPYNNCNTYCQDGSGINYPLSSSNYNGIMDMAFNSLDGDRSGDAEGPVEFYSQNDPPSGGGDNYQWSFFIIDRIEIEPPILNSIAPNQGTTGVSLVDPIIASFNKLMMSSSLKTGSTKIYNGQEYIKHKAINIWSLSNLATGYWTAKNNVDNSVPLDDEADYTQVEIRHSQFGDSVSYRAQIGSGVKDIYQNCFRPSSMDGGCTGDPSCCNGVASMDGSCP